MPTPRDDRYSAVKKLFCVEKPVTSQKRIKTRIFFQASRRVRSWTILHPAPLWTTQSPKGIGHYFFLVSQHVGQGTVSPTHYIVIHDSLDLPVDVVQVSKIISSVLLHFNLCFPASEIKLQAEPYVQLARHSGTVRVPAPRTLSLRPQGCLTGRAARAQGAKRYAQGEAVRRQHLMPISVSSSQLCNDHTNCQATETGTGAWDLGHGKWE